MDWIANMPGPQFLGLYAAVIVAILSAAFLAMRSGNGGDGLDSVVSTAPDPYEMAFMRGGEMEVAKLLLIELARRGYIQERTGTAIGGGKVYLRQTDGHPSPRLLQDPQRQIFELIGVEEQPLGKLMLSAKFRDAVAGVTRKFEEEMNREGLLISSSKKSRVFLYAATPIFALGAFKLINAVMHGRYNVAFLVIFFILSMAVLWAITRRRLTPRGKRYFQQTQTAYRGDTSDVVLDPGSAQSSDMLLHVGLFGAPILFGTAASGYATMLGLDPNRKYGPSGCGSSCGGSSSGGGDGGGCGGGCGGCGGGD